jgi:hypothetical protein
LDREREDVFLEVARVRGVVLQGGVGKTVGFSSLEFLLVSGYWWWCCAFDAVGYLWLCGSVVSRLDGGNGFSPRSECVDGDHSQRVSHWCPN